MQAGSREEIGCRASRMPKTANPALNLAPFGRWTLRDEAAQRRLALRSASPSLPEYRVVPDFPAVPIWRY
jgi:hypothetical protein